MVSRAEAACPSCGGIVSAGAGETRACPGCGARLCFFALEGCERAARPAIDEAAALAQFGRLFERDGEPEPGPPAATVALFYVPFYELSGTIAGITTEGRVVHRWAEAHLPGIEDRDEIGVSEIDPARLDDGDRLPPSPDLAAVLAAQGTVLTAEGEPEEVEAILAERVRIPADGDDTELLDRRFTILHYPIWRLRYVVRGESYQATVDGVTGSVLHARVRAKQRRRIFNGVFAAACLGYVLGTMLRHPGLGMPGLGRAIAGADWLPLAATVSLAAIGAGLYVLLVNAAWNALRYRNELVYHSGLKTRVLINRPQETRLDRGTARVRALWVRVFGPRRFDR